MAKTLLEQLKEMTVVVADSGDFESIEQFKPQDTTTNPSFSHGRRDATVSTDCGWRAPPGKKTAGPPGQRQRCRQSRLSSLAVAFGKKILAIVPGRVSTEVDARLSYDTAATMKQAKEIIQQYDEAGISRDRC